MWLSFEYDTAEGTRTEEIEEAPEDRQLAIRDFPPDVDQVSNFASL